MLAENIWYILKEIEYDKDPPVKQNEDIITTEYIKKLAEEWKKNKWNPNPHPPVEPIRPWYPSQPYHPNCPGYPAYPGWKPEVWCSTSTIFREDT
jgi:hypothetical protein